MDSGTGHAAHPAVTVEPLSKQDSALYLARMSCFEPQGQPMAISAFDSVLIREVREKIGGELARNAEVLLGGTIKDMEDYKRLIGRRSGLTTALEIMDQSEKRLTSPEPVQKRTA